MTTLINKKELILAQERAMAMRLANKILDKPKPPLWMIFIPVFFVFFIEKLNQYKKNIKNFTDNYLLIYLRAMDEAIESFEQNTAVNDKKIRELAKQIPDCARKQYIFLMHTLVEHYLQLLNSSGDSLKSLIRRAYQTKTNYILFCNCLNTAERDYNKALLPNLEGDKEELKEVIKRMNYWSQELRREDAEGFFSN